MCKNIKLRYSCINPKSEDELEFIIENARDITANTFKRNIGLDNYYSLENELGYSKLSTPQLRLNNDCCVNFYKSKTKDNKPVYYCQHSVIEYIYY